MITVNDNKINTINQISYENLINQILLIPSHSIRLPVPVDTKEHLSGIVITAVSLYFQVYSQILLKDHISIVCNYENGISDEKLTNREKITINKDRRRYEREHINEVWCGDSSVGPYLNVDGKKKRTYDRSTSRRVDAIEAYNRQVRLSEYF